MGVGNFIQSVDEFFQGIIPDEVGRAFFLHLPFWGLLAWIFWFFALHSGLWVIWAGLVFVVIPFLVATLSLKILKESQYQVELADGKITMFRAWCLVYMALTLTLIGIPGLYFGVTLQMIQTDAFTKAYWWVVEAWWKLFHFYQSTDKIKDIKEFSDHYIYAYKTWQVCFLISATAIAPGLLYWLYRDDKEVAEHLKREQIRLEVEAKEKLERGELEKARLEIKRAAYEKQRLAEAEAEEEERRKLQAKIKEVKGENPWDSGFL